MVEKRAKKKEEIPREQKRQKKMIPWVTKIVILENPGIDPITSRMQSGRSTQKTSRI